MRLVVGGVVNDICIEAETGDVDEVTLGGLLSVLNGFHLADIMSYEIAFEKQVYAVYEIAGKLVGSRPVVAASQWKNGQIDFLGVDARCENAVDDFVDSAVASNDDEVALALLTEFSSNFNASSRSIRFVHFVADAVLP